MIRSKTPFTKTMQVPGDKSISHRSVLFASIAEGETMIEGFLPGDDCLQTIDCFQRLGVAVERISETKLIIRGRGWDGFEEPKEPLYVGNSGTTIRLMLGVLAGIPLTSTIYGDESIALRPMDRVVRPLRQMGASIHGKENGTYAPLTVSGRELQGIDFRSPVASAQVKSALMLAGLRAKGETTITEPTLSRDHTERMMSAFGVDLIQSAQQVTVRGGQRLQATSVQIPGDISSAAFLLAAALMIPGSRITIEKVGLNPTRTGIIDVFRQMGAQVEIEQTDWFGHEPVGNISISCEELSGIEIQGEIIPRLIDEIPIIAVVATQARGETVIRDAQELKVKETNRIATIAQELRRLGAVIEETEDGLRVQGGTRLRGGVCHSHGDHRIGMAMLVAGLAAKERVRIEGAEAINVSFPGFQHYIDEFRTSIS